ncbi:hypothetical protein GGF50DRAFT_121322 [Schizophyllum commune]
MRPQYPPSAGIPKAAPRFSQQGSPAHVACKPSENGNERPSPRSQEFGFARLRAQSLLAAGEQIIKQSTVGPDGASLPPLHSTLASSEGGSGASAERERDPRRRHEGKGCCISMSDPKGPQQPALRYRGLVVSPRPAALPPTAYSLICSCDDYTRATRTVGDFRLVTPITHSSPDALGLTTTGVSLLPGHSPLAYVLVALHPTSSPIFLTTKVRI